MMRSHSPVRIPKGQEKTPLAKRMASSTELPVTLGDMMDQEVGTVPGPEVRVVHDLARAIHRSESTDCSVSWSAQERARAYINEHGFIAALDEVFRLQPLAIRDKPEETEHG